MRDGAPLPDWLSLSADNRFLEGDAPALCFDTFEVLASVIEEESATGAVSARTLVVPIEFLPEYAFPGAAGFRLTADGDDYLITTPQDFSGAVAVRHRAKDLKAAASSNRAFAVFNIEAQREVPIAKDDAFLTLEGQALTFTHADLLANDRDGDGDPIRVDQVLDGPLGSGAVTLHSDPLIFDIPPGASDGPIGSNRTYELSMSDGADPPDWLSLEDGRIGGLPPTGHDGALEIRLVIKDGVNPAVTTDWTLTPVPAGVLEAGALQAFEVALPDRLSVGLIDPVYTLVLPEGVDALPAG